MVTFSQIPSNVLVPFVAIELDGTRAGVGLETQPYRALLVAQRLSSGSAPLLAGRNCTAQTRVLSANDAAVLFGAGSIAHRMAIAWFAENTFTELDMIGVADAGGAVEAEYELTCTASSNAAGTIHLYVAGTYVPVGILASQTATQVAAAIVAAVNGAFALPFTAANTAGVVTFTARNAGTCGTADIRWNHRGSEFLPAGITLALASSQAGATDPAIADVWTTIGDTHYNVFSFGWYNDNLHTAIDAELESRAGPMRPIDGRSYQARFDTASNLVAWGVARNSKHICMLGRTGAASMWQEYAATVAAIVAREASRDPGLPYQTLRLGALLGPKLENEYAFATANQLLNNGISVAVSIAGVEYLSRLVTGYLRNALGAADTAFRDVPTQDVLSYLRYSLRNRLATRFARTKFAASAANLGPGVNVATPATIKGECLAWYAELEAAGYVENRAAFEAGLVVQQNGSDPNRADILLPVDLINMLIVRAASIRFTN